MFYSTFEQVLEDALSYGYKSLWILYRCKEEGIPLSIKDLYTIARAYGHKSAWVKYKAEEFNIGEEPKSKQANQKQAKQDPPKSDQAKYPRSYFDGIRDRKELKKAFRDWSKKLHPDIEGGDHAEFIRMNKEYEQKRMYCY